MKRLLATMAAVAGLALLAPPADAQFYAVQPPSNPEAPRRKQAEVPAPATAPDQSADEVRDELARLFDQFPPSLPQVLRLDPSLLSSEEYLAPYPALASFLRRHPEVARNPTFFVGDIR